MGLDLAAYQYYIAGEEHVSPYAIEVLHAYDQYLYSRYLLLALPLILAGVLAIYVMRHGDIENKYYAVNAVAMLMSLVVFYLLLRGGKRGCQPFRNRRRRNE